MIFGTASVAGAFYFAIIFTLGSALGVARAVMLSVWTDIHPAWAVLLELPLILSASWVCCGWLIARFAVAAYRPTRAWMGVVAFVLLMGAEAVLATWLAGRSLAEHIASYRQPAHALGLAGQMAFAAFPMLRR